MARRILSYLAWAFMLMALAVASVFTGSAIALALCIGLAALPLLGLVLVSLAMPKVAVSLQSPTVSPKQSGISCDLVASNASMMPLLRVEAWVCVENLLTAQREERPMRISLPPRGTVHMPFELSSDACGRLDCRVLRIRAYEPFSLFWRTRACDAERRLSVMPTLYDAYLRDVLAAAPLSDTTTYSPYVKGQDATEVFALRAYEPGDDLRRIHWKLSDKMDQLVVREASLPLDNSLLVFWDKGLYGADASPLRADAMAEVVLGVCECLCANGISYDVASNNVSDGRCQRECISSEDDIYELIGHLISSPLGDVAESGLESYARLFGAPAFSRIIYISAGLPAGMEEACRGRQAMALVCDDADGMESASGFTEIHFRSGDAASALAMAGMV